MQTAATEPHTRWPWGSYSSADNGRTTDTVKMKDIFYVSRCHVSIPSHNIWKNAGLTSAITGLKTSVPPPNHPTEPQRRCAGQATHLLQHVLRCDGSDDILLTRLLNLSTHQQLVQYVVGLGKREREREREGGRGKGRDERLRAWKYFTAASPKPCRILQLRTFSKLKIISSSHT